MNVDLPKSEILDAVDPAVVRRKGIGGSDVAAVVGFHPYRTAHDVWMEKLGLVKREVGEAAHWGKVVEPLILDEYARRENVAVEKFPFPTGFRRHPRRDWMMGNIDAVVRGAKVGVDAKMAGLRQAPRWGAPDTDEMPEEIVLQVQWYLAIMEDFARWDVPVLLGQNLRIYRVYPSRELQRRLVEICGEWWERYVLTKTPPPVDYSKGARRLLEVLFPQEQGVVRAVLPDEESLVWQYRQADRAIDDAIRVRDGLRNQICALIGEDAGMSGSGFKVTWKRTKDRRQIDWESVARALLPYLDVERLAQETGRSFESMVREYTAVSAGVRRFLATFEKEEEEEAAKAAET